MLRINNNFNKLHNNRRQSVSIAVLLRMAKSIQSDGQTAQPMPIFIAVTHNRWPLTNTNCAQLQHQMAMMTNCYDDIGGVMTRFDENFDGTSSQ